jgi:hypothetical protein
MINDVSDGRAIVGFDGPWHQRERLPYAIEVGGGFGDRLDRRTVCRAEAAR